MSFIAFIYSIEIWMRAFGARFRTSTVNITVRNIIVVVIFIVFVLLTQLDAKYERSHQKTLSRPFQMFPEQMNVPFRCLLSSP